MEIISKNTQSYIKKLKVFFPREFYKNFYTLSFLLILGSSLEAFGISTFYLFLKIVTEENSVYKDFFTNEKINLDENQFISLFSLLILFLIVLRVIVQILIINFNFNLVKKMNYVLSKSFFYSYMRMPYKRILESQSNKIILNVWSHTMEVVNKAYVGSITIFSTLIFGIVILLTVLLIEFKTTILFVLIISLNVILYFALISKKIFLWNQKFISFHKEVIKLIMEMVKGAKIIRIFSIHSYFFDQFKTSASNALSLKKKLDLINNFPKFFLELNFVIIVFLYISFNTYNGKAFFDLLPFLGLIAISGSRIIPLISQLTVSIQQFKNSVPSFLSINEDLKRLNISFDDKITDIKFKNYLRLSNVLFKYNDDQDKIVIKNLKLKRGDNNCFIGRSGSGKTTAVNIILGLLRPLSGDYFFDKKKINYKSLENANIFSYVPQEPFIFNASIGENITFKKKLSKSDHFKLKKISEMCEISDLIKEKGGLDYILKDDGKNLSGGQIQRIMIARSIFIDSKILVFDEPTSYLDNINKKSFFKILKKLKKENITTIIISHDIELIKQADTIYYFEGKKLLDWGNWIKLKKNYNAKRLLSHVKS